MRLSAPSRPPLTIRLVGNKYPVSVLKNDVLFHMLAPADIVVVEVQGLIAAQDPDLLPVREILEVADHRQSVHYRGFSNKRKFSRFGHSSVNKISFAVNFGDLNVNNRIFQEFAQAHFE